ncbi:hypothetical protein AVEN_129389-1 [Araneus ventricosus]|uniref:Uncharacterized protein n=1 Tax=Araneus ventricosus TaxID=182803 RepID=A0A4Y2K9E4_ARAVE|nr:hypothetical protein AVEN_65115-1 [Araneus ventricosus]GBM98834.1 hypothetical protein AVEN_129389-1 [Araneus ventricosus]
METKRLALPAWEQEYNRSILSSLICSCCSAGLALILTGSVLVALFRKTPTVTDFAMGGVAVLVLGTVLVAIGITVGVLAFCARQKFPKTSSAAKAEVTPDPLRLVPVYTYNTEATSNNNNHIRSQLMLLPGSLDPIEVTYSVT